MHLTCFPLLTSPMNLTRHASGPVRRHTKVCQELGEPTPRSGAGSDGRVAGSRPRVYSKPPGPDGGHYLKLGLLRGAGVRGVCTAPVGGAHMALLGAVLLSLAAQQLHSCLLPVGGRLRRGRSARVHPNPARRSHARAVWRPCGLPRRPRCAQFRLARRCVALRPDRGALHNPPRLCSGARCPVKRHDLLWLFMPLALHLCANCTLCDLVLLICALRVSGLSKYSSAPGGRGMQDGINPVSWVGQLLACR